MAYYLGSGYRTSPYATTTPAAVSEGVAPGSAYTDPYPGRYKSPTADLNDPFAKWIVGQTKPLDVYQPTPVIRDWGKYGKLYDAIDSYSLGDRTNLIKTLEEMNPGFKYTAPGATTGDAARYELLRNDLPTAWSTLTAGLAANGGGGGAPDAWRDYVMNSFDRVKNAYAAAEMASGQGANFTPFYDWARDYNFGADYYNASPQSRGFYLGGGGPSGRILRGF